MRWIDIFSFIVLMCSTNVLADELDRYVHHVLTKEWVEEWIEEFAQKKLSNLVTNAVMEAIYKRNESNCAPLFQMHGDQDLRRIRTPGPIEKSINSSVSSCPENKKPADQVHSETIAARKEMDGHKSNLANKDHRVIVFVTGPESTGNRYTVDMIIKAAGCAGKSGHVQPLDHKVRGKNKDWSFLDKRVLIRLKSMECVVIHRSFPHNHHFVNLKRMAKTARENGFEPRVIVLTRFMPATIKSQIARKHVPNEVKARENIKRAYLEIFDGVFGAKLPFTMVTYEFLGDEYYIRWLFNELGINYNPEKVPNFKEANSKYME